MNTPWENIAYTAARRYLLDPHGLEETHLASALARIAQAGADDADLYFQYARNESWSLEEGIVKSGSFHIDQGMGVRAVEGEKTAFAYSDELSTDALQAAAHTVRAIARQGERASTRLPPTRAAARAPLYAPLDPLASLEATKKVTLLEYAERTARACDPRVMQVMANLSGMYEVIYIARQNGLRVADIRPLVRMDVQVIVEHAGRRESGHAGGGGRYDYGYFTEPMVASYAREAVRQALVNLEARPAPAGEMPVVLGRGWAGVLLHEAVGHGLEGDFNRKGSSAFSGRLGERVAAPGVTVVDDGAIVDRRGSLNVDDEGHPTQRTVLIEDGILCGYMQDSLNARLMGSAQTGNGRRESYAHLPMPRMTNTLMLGGSTPAEEILASVERGVYAVNFGGGQVDITNGKFVFETSEAYWVEGGKIQYPIKGASLIGNGPDVLTHVRLIGDDMALDSGIGSCGKNGQSVPVGVGQPTVRIDGGLTVGGTA